MNFDYHSDNCFIKLKGYILKFHKINEKEIYRSHGKFLEMQKSFNKYLYNGIEIEAWPTVYHPGNESSTLFMLKHLPQIKDKKILEIGCGTGLIGLSLAKKNQVVLGDINPQAVDCSRYNSQLNKIPVEVHQSDLFSAFEDKSFDVILFNTPYWHRPLEDDVELLACDPNGELFQRFIEESTDYLNEGGTVIFTYSNLSNEETFHNTVTAKNFEYSIIGQEQDEQTHVIRWLVEMKVKK